MADAHGAEGGGDAKGGGKAGFFSEWVEIGRNWFKRKVPFVDRFRFGRRKVGDRPHPIQYELQSTWIEKNTNLFGTTLKRVENEWAKLAVSMGEGQDPNKGFLEDPQGIVPLYQKLGVYADLERIPLEVNWFETGTGFHESKLSFEMPEEAVWRKYGWIEDEVKKLKKNSSKIKAISDNVKIKRISLHPGTVIHEGKIEEDIYAFGIERAKQMIGEMTAYSEILSVGYLRQKGVGTEVRTKIDNLIKQFTSLFQQIAEMENEAYSLLQDLTGDAKILKGRWELIADQTAPESTNVSTIRFPHTFRIIRQYALLEITEKIEKKTGITTESYENKRVVTSYIDPNQHTATSNIYTIEKQKLNDELASINSIMTDELKYIVRDIQSFEQLVNNTGSFENVIKGIIRAERNNLIGVLNSTDLPEAKIQNITDLITHPDPTLASLLEESLKNIVSIISSVVNSRKSADEKVDDIENSLLNSFSAIRIIEEFLAYHENDVVGILKERDDRGNKRKVDDVFEDIRHVLLPNELATSSIIDTILNDKNHRAQIKALINKQKDEFVTARTIIRFIRISVVRKNLDDKEAGLKTRLEILNIKKSDIELKFLEEKKRLQDRLDEIDGISPRDMQDILDSIRPKISAPNAGTKGFYKRPEELKYGLDEYGYPLEIDPGNGIVLIDKWWHEIGQNEWQMKTIAQKHEGADTLRKNLGVTVNYTSNPGEKPKLGDINIAGTPAREIRYVTDQRFIGQVDILDLSAFMYSYWDAVRDDLRDGRYHPHSKSTGDYVIEAMGGYHKDLGAPYSRDWVPGLKSKGMFFSRRGVVPLKPIQLHIDVPTELIKSNPETFNKHIPDDEKTVTRDYAMRMPDGSVEKGERHPSKYNPAFDRRSWHIEKYVHWGRMYYWEWAGGINRWSENTFPHVSTRGLALYIAHLASTDTYYYKEAEEAIEGHSFDYGTRGMGAFPIMNPLSGKNIVGEGTEN